MECIFENIYRIGIPLPGSPLKELNVFVIKGHDRNLIIDTGFNHDDCENAMREALEEIGISMENTDIFLTHLHADHTGLCERLKTDTSKVFIRESDGNCVNGFLKQEYWDNLMNLQNKMNIPEQEKLDFKNHPAYKNRTTNPVTFTYVNDGTVFHIGGYRLECVDLSGHTPGQLGLWCMEKGILFCGDHILAKVTPNIGLWDFDNDYLEIYMRNLRKVKTMGIKHLFSAHRSHIEDVDGRIDELLKHHQDRLDEIIDILSKHMEMGVYQVAQYMRWDYGGGDFTRFPAQQKWFACSEVFAHLEHLRRIEKTDLNISENRYLYFLKKD